ncbi:uncharacterized protein LOC114936048 isoform X2 [Nylanderia fulva]|uniref:uncharacterized protein LOC114936048 isoform X2 n=1 Tax=Nylanderia fulva TaxID=613905 RepID=UPI0010FBB6F6|nr:uncharacterized protein LOC114936048 isoform X2 [Nylanderia fulva]
MARLQDLWILRRNRRSSTESTIKIPRSKIYFKSWDTSLHSVRLAEGGPISISSTTQHANIENSTIAGLNKPDESRTEENVPKEHAFFIKKEKIKPRKGVDLNMDPKMTINQTSSKNTESVMETVSAETVKANNQFNTSTIDTPKLNVTNLHVNNSLNRSINSSTSLTSANATTSHTEATNHTTPKASSHIEKHIPKPKPTVTTVDGPEPNESRLLSSRSKNPPLGMPRKIDYIVPVIITIIALPILGAVIFVLYRRGRDCWDKRHYRRMDFLIDGMYND